MQLADGRADSTDLLKVVRAFSRGHHVFDMAGEAQQTGTVVSAVMLGAIAGSGLFPFAREHYENVVRAGGGKSAEASLRGFARAFEIVQRGADSAQALTAAGKVAASESEAEPRKKGAPLPPDLAAEFPPAVHDMLALGHARMLEYQDRCLRRPVPAAHARGAGSRARLRPAVDPCFRHHPRGGALAGAVDGVRRHRAGGRPQEPGQPLAAREGRSEGRRRRPVAHLRSLQARRRRICGAVAGGAGPARAALGPQAGARGQDAMGPAAEGTNALRVRHGRAARPGRPEAAARARQPLCRRAGDAR